MNNARKKRPGTQPCSIIPIDVGARTPRSHNGLRWARIRYALESGGFYLQHQNERQVIESPRQCVFTGSVNHSTYLRDETGGRRFWPVHCGEIDVDALARNRDQLWAEAVSQYRGGEVWWLETPELNREAERQQSDRYEEDAWHPLIAAWVEHPERRCDGTGNPVPGLTCDDQSVSILDILNHCIGKRQDLWTHTDQTRVARCLRALKWERFQQRNDHGVREWRYRKKASQLSPVSPVCHQSSTTVLETNILV
jgi:putative DNA primase/helicase